MRLGDALYDRHRTTSSQSGLRVASPARRARAPGRPPRGSPQILRPGRAGREGCLGFANGAGRAGYAGATKSAAARQRRFLFTGVGRWFFFAEFSNKNATTYIWYRPLDCLQCYRGIMLPSPNSLYKEEKISTLPDHHSLQKCTVFVHTKYTCS